MSITAGLLLVFLNIFLPGLIFLRSYFKGEFSKQFNTRVPILRLAFYSLIPGIVFFLLSVSVYPFFDTNFKLSEGLEVYRNLLSTDGDLSVGSKKFLNNHIWIYLIFLCCAYFSAGFFGVLLHYIVRKANLDKKYKILRFKNYWYYIFSGEVAKFSKFDKAITSINIENIDNQSDVLITYADILVDECGKSKLYTGYILDYELDQENINTLDKIYLLDAHKYNSIKAENKRFKFQPGFIKKPIPGHLFVIDYKKVLNLNLTYVPSLNWILKKHEIKFRLWSRFDNVFQILFLVALALNISTIWFQWPINVSILDDYSNFQKIILTFLFNSSISLFFSIFDFMNNKSFIENMRGLKKHLQNEMSKPENFKLIFNEYISLKGKMLKLYRDLEETKKTRFVSIVAIIIFSLIFYIV